MKTLIIVESPHKAESIQKLLSKDYIVLASKGHIADLASGGKFGIGVDIEKNFKPHYILKEDSVDILDKLLSAAKQCDQILVASDPDREGEAIAWHLASRLEDTEKPIKRMVYQEITKAAILKAIKNVRDIDMNLFHAQEARRILDRLVGFTASPFLMNIYNDKLSAGRVQSVVTRMIIDKEREIETFIPQDFWTIQVSLAKNTENFIAKYSYQLIDEKIAKSVEQGLLNTDYIVSDVIDEEKKKLPMPPLVTSTLQQIMSKEHSFAADKTMKAAQGLYEAGHCTYIRTDSIRVSDDALTEVREWLTSNNHPIPKKPNVYKNKDAAQDAHECIRPSNLSVLPKNLHVSADEKQVYEVIWKYFVASQMMPAIYSTLKVKAHVTNNKQLQVTASGKSLKDKGFLDILEIDDKSKIEIPHLVKGDVLTLFSKNPVKLEKKQTQAPARFSESNLIKELDSRGIGRPATYADLLTKISNRNYVDKRGNVYHATDLGKKITDTLTKYFKFLDYNYTADMEAQLDAIASGTLDHVQMLKSFYPPFKKEIDKAYEAHGSLLCEKCNSPMVERTVKATGVKFSACSNYPKCKNTVN